MLLCKRKIKVTITIKRNTVDCALFHVSFDSDRERTVESTDKLRLKVIKKDEEESQIGDQIERRKEINEERVIVRRNIDRNLV